MQEVKRNLYERYDWVVNEMEAQFDSMTHLQTVFAGLSSQITQKDTEGELERRFQTYLSCLWKFSDFGIFSVAASRVERDMTMMTKSSASEWLRWIYWLQIQETVLNIVNALQLFLTFPVSVAIAERSFSKLKLIKSYLWSSISQDHLSN